MVALALIGSFATNSNAQAQPCTCNIVNGCKVVTIYDAAGNPISTETICPTTGTGTFACDEIEPPPPPPAALNVSVRPVNIVSTATSPTAGTITTQLDPSRISSNATIVSNIPGVRFPASVHFSFYATSSYAGATYFSRDELRFANENVNSFNPFNNENFTLQNDVSFVSDPNDPTSPVAFVLHAGSQVTLN
jgi:hypothetical protein